MDLTTTEEKADLLGLIEPFNYLDEDSLNEIASRAEHRDYPEGSYICRQGEKSSGRLYLVARGKVELSVGNARGKKTVAGYRNNLSFFGETVLFSEEEGYPGNAVALTPTTCLEIKREDIEEMFEQSSEFAAYFAQLLADRMRILYQKFELREEEGAEEDVFRRVVSNIMNTGVVTCRPDNGVQQMAELMYRHDVSSVIITEGNGSDGARVLGIVTEGDLVARVLREPNIEESITRTAEKIMTANPITIRPGEFAFQAFLLMARNGCKHLPVTEDGGRLVGIVSMRDLVNSRRTGSLAIIDRVESASDIHDLATLRPEIDRVLQALLVERASAREINALITEFYDRITRRVIELSEMEMVQEGHGPPPAGFCFISMGSSGRKEQFTRTDQDNGIIYENVPPAKEKSVEDYFLTLGEKIVNGLETFGFERCKGGVMANNKAWTRSNKEWRAAIDGWLLDAKPENVRLMTIFLDFRYIYGRQSLYYLLRNFVIRSFRNNLPMLRFLVEDNLTKKIPLNIFRRIQTERSGEHRDQLNLKSSASVHMVDCTRVLALSEGLLVTNTFERLEGLGKREALKQEDVELLIAAYESIMMLRIRDSLEKMKRGERPDNYINPDELSSREQLLLRDALIMVRRLQTTTSNLFRPYLP